MQIALKYLRTTRLANEDIALALGFSDAANFRRAFRRWTNKSPSVLTHSFASRFCDGERFFGAAVLYKDGFGAGGPLEGLWVLVSMLDPLVNRGLEFGDVVEGSSPDALASDFGEEPLDEVEPGTGCRGEVQCEAFVSHQPPFHGRRLVGGVVVEDQMQIEMCGRLAVDCFQKRQELVCPMACQTFADDGTGRHIE